LKPGGDTSPVLVEAARHRVPEQVQTRGARRADFRDWRASLPSPLERDTFLMPDVIAETIVAEAEGFLHADLPAGFAGRLAGRAHHLYAVNPRFKRILKGPGNQGRDWLYVYMRHWTAGWLQREQNSLARQFPREYALGLPLPMGNR
jgi:hypothetical protein